MRSFRRSIFFINNVFLSFQLLLLVVEARYDPLQINTTRSYPDLITARSHFDATVAKVREEDAQYQHVYQYQTNPSTLQWMDGNPNNGRASSSNDSHCLHFRANGKDDDDDNNDGDDLLQNLRIAYLAELIPTLAIEDIPRVTNNHDHFRLDIPNVGIYDSLEAAIEYIKIAVGSVTGGFSFEIMTQLVHQTPYFASRDVLAITSAQLRDWNRGGALTTYLVHFELHFRPCSVAIDGATITFDQDGVETFLEQQYSNRYLCERIQQFCTGMNQQYDSELDCVEFMDSIEPTTDPACEGTGYSSLRQVHYSLEGNTTSCRFLHHFMASDQHDFRPEVHCPHVGKHGGPDPNMEYKCSSAACRKEREIRTTRDKEETLLQQRDELPECHPEWKEEAELALLAVLPTCWETLMIAKTTCTDECRQALTQFALAGYKQSTDNAKINQNLSLRTRSCICSDEIRQHPRSSVLKGLVDFSPANLLASCGMMAPLREMDNQGTTTTTTTATGHFDVCQEFIVPASQVSASDVAWAQSEEFMKEVLEDIIDRSIDSVETFNTLETEEMAPAESKSLLMDVEYIKLHAGDNFHHLLPPSAVTSGCPFFHGPIVQSYGHVLDILNSEQTRTRTNALFNVDIHQDFPHEAVTSYSTGTPEHLGLRASFFEAFPILSKPLRGDNAIQFNPLPPELSEVMLSSLLGSTGGSTASAADGLFRLQSLLRYALEPLFPGSDEFLNRLSRLFVEWSAITDDITRHTSTWHAVAGEGRVRLYSMYLQQATKLMRSYFGPEKMDYFSGLTKFTKTGDEIATAWAAQLYNGFLFMGFALGQVLRQIGTDPCMQTNIFQDNPEAYVLEVLRTGNHGLGGNAIIETGESYSVHYDGKEIVYKGRKDWKSGQPYAVQYSLSGANKDEEIFPKPTKFDPSRDNLDMTLTFGAPESTFNSGLFEYDSSAPFNANAGMRGCVAHNYAVGMIVTLTREILAKETICYHRKFQGSYKASVLVTWVLVGLMLLLHVIIWVLLETVAQRHMDKCRKRVDATDAFNEESSYISQPLHQGEDFAKRMLSLRSVFLAKSSSKGPEYVAEKMLLEGISLDILAGRVTAIMGQSGAGKSSLLNTIARFNDPGLVASGTIDELSEVGKRCEGGVSYVHHDYQIMLFEDLTGMENLLIGAMVRVKDMSSDHDEVAQAMKELVDGMKLRRCLDTPVKNMSSGEKRRMSIAVECLRPSRIMLLDEPLAGLDSAVALETMKFLKTICKKYMKMMLLIIHQPSVEVYSELDDLIIMKAGRCVFNGPRSNALKALGVNGKSMANPSDALMEHVASTHPGQLTAINEDGSSSDDHDSLYSTGRNSISSTFDPSEISAAELVPFQQRFLACILVTWLGFRRDKTTAIGLFVAIPVATFFLALYNVGPTQPHEAIAMLVILIAGPSCLMVQTTGLPLVTRLLSYVNMKRFGLYSGAEYSLHMVLFFGTLSFVMTLIVYSTSLLVGLVEIMTVQRFTEALAVALALTVSVAALDLALRLHVSRPGIPENQFYTVNNHMNSVLMIFLAVGVVLSGLLYRSGTAGIPFLYDILSVLSPAFWGGLALMVSLLDGAVFPECRADNALLCLGDTYLLSYGLADRPYIPGFSIWFLLIVTFLAGVASVGFGHRPLEKPLPFVDESKIVCKPYKMAC